MRDPDRPRGNPLFDDLDASDDAAPRSADGGSDAADPGSGETSGANGHTFRNTRREGPDGPDDTGEPESGVQTLVEALMAAGPETADHLLRAMEELLLAARTVMVAAEKGIVEQRAADRRAPGSDEAASGDDVSEPTDGGSGHSGFSSIDLD